MTKNIKHLLSGITVCSFLILAVASGDKKADKDGATKTETKEAAPAAMQISAKQLYADYNANEVAADQKYKGKVLLVTGAIDNIGKDIMDDIYVTIKGDEVIGDVQCFFSKDNVSETAKLTKGQDIAIQGKCDGKMMNILLKDCTIVQTK